MTKLNSASTKLLAEQPEAPDLHYSPHLIEKTTSFPEGPVVEGPQVDYSNSQTGALPGQVRKPLGRINTTSSFTRGK